MSSTINYRYRLQIHTNSWLSHLRFISAKSSSSFSFNVFVLMPSSPTSFSCFSNSFFSAAILLFLSDTSAKRPSRLVTKAHLVRRSSSCSWAADFSLCWNTMYKSDILSNYHTTKTIFGKDQRMPETWYISYLTLSACRRIISGSE